MKKIKKLVLSLVAVSLIATVFYSCNDEEGTNFNEKNSNSTIDNENLKGKGSGKISLKNPFDNVFYDLYILKVNPFEIESVFFETKKMNIYDADKNIIAVNKNVVVFKESYRQSYSNGGGYRIWDGWWWNDSDPNRDCFVYGTWYEDLSTGELCFDSASYETQILMNWCSDWGTKYA